MRILQAPRNVAGQPWAYAQGLRRLGHDVEVWHDGPAGFGFPADRLIDPQDAPRSHIDAFRRALDADFDVLHFHFTRSLLPAHGPLPWFWDLPVWRALGKLVVFTFHGSDVRRRSIEEAADEHSYYRYGDVPSDEERIGDQLQVIRAFADHLTIANPNNWPHVPDARYVPKAVDTSRLQPVGPVNRDRPVVLHAPSRRSTKGTDLVLSALQHLQERGVRFDLDLVEGASHDDLLRRVAAADVVVEKVLGGDVGVLGLEAMAMGKCLVSRIRPATLTQHPDLPAVSADPTTVVDVLADVLGDWRRRERLADRGREYVVANHDVGVVGHQLQALYGSAPRKVLPVFPGWTTPRAQDKVARWQERVQALEARNAALQRELTRLRGAAVVSPPESAQTSGAAERAKRRLLGPFRGRP